MNEQTIDEMTPSERQAFVSSIVRESYLERDGKLPTPGFVYRHFDIENNLLYVGVTKNVVRRHQQHRAHSPWWPQVARVSADGYFEIDCARQAESVAIFREDPLKNVLGRRR